MKSPFLALDGSELDEAIAEQVMGFKWMRLNRRERRALLIGPELQDRCWPSQPSDERETESAEPYSTDIAAAMEVVEKMMSLGYRYVMRGNFRNNQLHHAAFDHAEWADENPLYQSRLERALPEAICRAALAAIEHNAPERDAETNQVTL